MPRGGRVWSTDHMRDDLHAYWTAAHAEAFHELKVDLPDPEQFKGRIWHDQFGTCDIGIILNGKQTLHRTREAVSRSQQTGQLALIYLRSGHMVCEQYGNSAELHSGSTILVDSRGEYKFTNPCACEHLALLFPETWLQAFINDPDEFVARPITSATPWGTALNTTLGALCAESLDQLLLPHQLIISQIAGLLTLAIGPSDTSLTKHARKMYLRALQQIEALAHDAELDAEILSTSLNISTRYLHALFAAAGTTYAHQLLRVRMERAAQMLSDPRFAKHSISEIAAICGFNDPSHFARRFRERLQQSPGAYRALHLNITAISQTTTH